MTSGTIRRASTALVLSMLLAVPALRAGDPKPPDQPDPDQFPELAGAERVEGPVRVDGQLARPYLDYSTAASGASQRLSLFQNGLAVVTTENGGKTLHKRLLIPPGAVDAYREMLSTRKLSEISQLPDKGTPTPGRETIRIYDRKGAFVERSFDPSFILSGDLERMRGLLLDLMRVISEDREITNVMDAYQPEAGDQLLSEDFQRWLVVRVIADSGYVEMRSMSDPLSQFVAIDDLSTRFLTWSRVREQPPEE